MRRFPGGVCVRKLKCCLLTKLVVPDLCKRKLEKIAKVTHSRLSPNRLLKVEGNSHFDLHFLLVLLLKASPFSIPFNPAFPSTLSSFKPYCSFPLSTNPGRCYSKRWSGSSGVVAANMVVVMGIAEKPGGGVISFSFIMPKKKARPGFDEIKEFFRCRNEMGRGLAQRPVIMEVSHDLRGDSWGCVPRSLFWREDLDGDGERGFDCLTFALVLSKAYREGCRASHPIRALKGRLLNQGGGPDIAFVVRKLNHYASNPSLKHSRAVFKVLGYLKRTSALNLPYTSYLGVLEGYLDASWVNHIGSVIGYPTVARSNAFDSMYCDNQATLSKAYNSVSNGRSRHIRLRHNYVRQVIKNDTINVVYVRSCRNLADTLTKPLTRDLLTRIRFFWVDGVPALYATVLKFSSSAPFETIQPCRIPYLLGEPTNIPSSESQINSLDIVHVGDGHGGEKEEEGEEKESFKAPVLIELQPREPTRGIEDMFLKAIVLNDIHDDDVAQYYMELFNDLWKACSSSSSTGRETFPLKGGKGVAAVNGTRYLKFLEVPAASLVQAIEKNLSAFVVNVIGDSLVNVVKDGGIISDIIWSDDVVGSGLDVVAHYKKKYNILSTLHFLKILENSLEVLKVLKNSLEVLKVLQMKLQENSSIDEVESLSIKNPHPRFFRGC
nr:microtubule-associated protein RP/EB family member 1 [Tanacetum cinerariifolium]